jgi:hypothetical protein
VYFVRHSTLILSNYPPDIPFLKFSIHNGIHISLSIELKIKTVIALAVFIQLQESLAAKVIYLNEIAEKK